MKNDILIFRYKVNGKFEYHYFEKCIDRSPLSPPNTKLLRWTSQEEERIFDLNILSAKEILIRMMFANRDSKYLYYTITNSRNVTDPSNTWINYDIKIEGRLPGYWDSIFKIIMN